MNGSCFIAIPERLMRGKGEISSGSVRSSHSSKKMPGLVADLNEKKKVFDSPGFKMLLGYIKYD